MKNKDPKAMKVLSRARIRVDVELSSVIRSLLSGPKLTVYVMDQPLAVALAVAQLIPTTLDALWNVIGFEPDPVASCKKKIPPNGPSPSTK